MNQKITFPELVNLVAETTDTPKKLSEDFLKELFSLIATTLVSGENVKIKKLGTFKVIDVEPRKSVNVNSGEEMLIPEHKKITFTPDKELAEAVNSPFSAFEAVEISDEVTDEMINAVDNLSSPQENNTQSLNKINREIQHKSNIDEKIEELPKIEWEEDSDDLTERSKELQSAATETTDTFETTTYKLSDNDEYTESSHSKKTFFKGFIWGIASLFITLIILSATLYFIFHQQTSNIFNKVEDKLFVSEETATAKQHSNIDCITNNNQIRADISSNNEPTETANTQPSDQPVYDTISRTRFLTTMAKEHYGNYNLWPYIYEENKHILGHPDRIKPGTKVVIPTKEKYGIDPTSEDCIEKAKQKGAEIYSRYKKQLN